MQVIKQSFIIIFIICSLQNIQANENQSVSISESENKITLYAGINPLALIAFLPDGLGVAGTLFGVLSGQEFGVSLYGGINFVEGHSLEMRFSTGPAGDVIWDTQLQFGYIWYPLEQFLNWNGGLSAGIMLRQFFWKNRITDYTNFNLTPELIFGWRFIVNSLAFDIRGGWNIASVTWSNMPYTKTATGWTPFPYNLAITFGVAWIFNK